MASTTSTSSPSTTTTTTTSSTGAKNNNHQTQTGLNLSANFAHPSTTTTTSNPKSPTTIGYDHEVYLQLMAGRGETIPKTPNQIYREERARRRTTRALDPAILDPQGDPSPVDLECAEREGAKERLRF